MACHFWIEGRRRVCEGAEGGGWYKKGAEEFLKAQKGGDGTRRAQRGLDFLLFTLADY